METAQKALEAKGLEDEAFRFECLTQYLREDHKPGKPLTYCGMAIGL
jgi:hypothetical protein